AMKAGGAYVPRDPAYPAERLDFMLRDSEAAVLLTTDDLRDRVSAFTGESASPATPAEDDGTDLGVPTTSGAPANPDSRGGNSDSWGEDLDGGAGPGDLAYVIYTSGSTGLPKGVMIEHRGLRNLAEEQARTFGVGPGSRVCQFVSHSFDASVSDLLMALTTGATLCLVPPEAALPGPALAELLGRERI